MACGWPGLGKPWAGFFFFKFNRRCQRLLANLGLGWG